VNRFEVGVKSIRRFRQKRKSKAFQMSVLGSLEFTMQDSNRSGDPQRFHYHKISNGYKNKK